MNKSNNPCLQPIIPTRLERQDSTMRLYGEMMLPKLPPLPIRYLSDVIMQKLEIQAARKTYLT